jgi:hypothetical protein
MEKRMRASLRHGFCSFCGRSAVSPEWFVNVLAFVLLTVSAGCGTGYKLNPNNVSVSVSPAAAATSTNGQVQLQATVQGLGSGDLSSISLWTITENPSGANCATDVGIVPPGPCPAGTIQIAGGDELTVTYFAPSTPGTYHVNAEWEDFVNLTGPPIATKTGTSVITVGP